MARRGALIAALLLAVLLGHALVLQWLAWQVQDPSALRLMAAPMLTRLLQQQAPAPVAQAVVTVRAPPARKPVAMKSVAPSVPAQSSVTEAQPEPAPEPPPPEVAASEPVPTEPEAATATAVATPDAQPEPPGPAVTPSASLPQSTDSVGVGPDGWPIDTRLSYRVSGFYRGPLYGSARVEWLRDGDRYQTRIDIDLGLVSLAMTSQGQVRGKELLPSAYEEIRPGRRRAVQIQDKIVLSDGREMDRPEGVQDTASQFIDLSHRFASGQSPLEVGRSVSLWLARPGGVDYWTYEIIGKESLQTPFLGAVETFRLQPRQIDNPRGNITAEIWIAPSLQYLPVRIRITQGEANVDLAIEKIEQR